MRFIAFLCPGSILAPASEDGSRRYSRQLIDLFRDGRVHDSEEIISKLGIDPRDLEACRLLQNQLLGLQRHGLLAETIKGWKWLR